MTEFASRPIVPGDRPLRRDQRLLGWQFRHLIQQHCGHELWDQLHELRTLAEQRRAGDAEAEAAIVVLLSKQDATRLAVLARAMGMFFDLANLAEDRHRVRVLGKREDEGQERQTIRQGVLALCDAMPADAARDVLERLQIEPVFTAHPTEAKRRTVRRILRRLGQDLTLIDRSSMLRSERQRCLDRMQRDLLALWSTDGISPRKPTVMEELDRTIYTLRMLWRVGPRVVEKLRIAAAEVGVEASLDQPLQFGNWIGGDRDGNPFVTCSVTHETLEHLRAAAVDYHRKAAQNLSRRLTVSTRQYALPSSLQLAIEQARLRWPKLARHLDPLHPDEWLVHWLTIMDQRLRHSKNLAVNGAHPMAYSSTEELSHDLAIISDALQAVGLIELTEGALERWEERIRIFGLHLVRLDIRFNAEAVREAVGQLLKSTEQCADYAEQDDAGRQSMLHTCDPVPASRISTSVLSPEAADLLDVLTLTQRVARTGGMDALGQFIVSMTQQPSDILAVLWLMEVAAHRAGYGEAVALPVAPLFETVDDLAASDVILDAILKADLFQAHLARAERRIYCMIGYSDSAKDGGYMAANWALYDGQRRLAACALKHEVPLTIFHGRGGAIGRGGGPAARAIMSLPHEAVNGRLRLTEQGEVIAERYNEPGIAIRHLEQLFWATIMQSVPHEDRVPPEAEALARKLAACSEQAYRALIAQPGFIEYLTQCTALPLIEKLPIGSRPSRRSATTQLGDLRAIPFTFAWTQARMPINAFFGLGAAYASLDVAECEQATELYQSWPWFRAVIDNAELALAQCDAAIARRYALRAEDPEEALAMWQLLKRDYALSERAILAIKQEKSLVSKIPWLSRTIRVRNPYLDMLNLVQLELMSRVTDESTEMDEALRLTVQAIAAGLRTTG